MLKFQLYSSVKIYFRTPGHLRAAPVVITARTLETSHNRFVHIFILCMGGGANLDTGMVGGGSIEGENAQSTTDSEGSAQSKASNQNQANAEKSSYASAEAQGLSKSQTDALIQTKVTYQREKTFRQSSSKSKSIKYKVEGGTDLEFTQKFYSDSFPVYFSKWLESVINDSKSFNFKAQPISDLLHLSAFDFFPQCANVCGFGAAECDVKYQSNNGEKTVSMPCFEFDKISSRLNHKHSVLMEALRLYANMGKLTPVNHQSFDGGPRECSELLWPIFELNREEFKAKLGLQSGIFSYRGRGLRIRNNL